MVVTAPLGTSCIVIERRTLPSLLGTMSSRRPTPRWMESRSENWPAALASMKGLGCAEDPSKPAKADIASTDQHCTKGSSLSSEEIFVSACNLPLSPWNTIRLSARWMPEDIWPSERRYNCRLTKSTFNSPLPCRSLPTESVDVEEKMKEKVRSSGPKMSTIGAGAGVGGFGGGGDDPGTMPATEAAAAAATAADSLGNTIAILDSVCNACGGSKPTAPVAWANFASANAAGTAAPGTASTSLGSTSSHNHGLLEPAAGEQCQPDGADANGAPPRGALPGK
mmetsp:Transcript_120138/g.299715  ORF Transcript_120138/g.299715 Transcript_120138/m.299715 type:complete len:281 (+) Transcript_120138:356-1198(+)